jgi:integrase
MAKRRRIATYGRRGQLVRVFDELANGSRLVRVQWNEVKGAPLSTESWPYSKDNVGVAKAYAEGVSDRLAAGMLTKRTDYTIAQLAELYVAAMEEGWAPSTLANFQHRWGRFLTFAGRNTSAKLVNEETLDEFRGALRKIKVAVNQRGEIIKVVKMVFRWARQRKLIAENPIADYTVKLAKGEKRAEIPEWNPEETTKLGAQLIAERASRKPLGWRLEVMFFVAASQGPRQNALRHLSIEDVNLSAQTRRHRTAPDVVLPPRSVWWNPAFDKLGEERVQPLSRGAVRAIRIAMVWRKRLKYTGPWLLFGAQTRTQQKPWGYQAANQALRELVRRAGLKWVTGRAFHGFRKHAAGEVARITGSERAAADWIGDKDVKIVRKHYLKKRAEEQREVAASVSVDVLQLHRPAARVHAPAPARAPKPVTHGTRTGYNRGCRCDACRDAQRDHIRALRGTEPGATRGRYAHIRNEPVAEPIRNATATGAENTKGEASEALAQVEELQ